MQRNASRAATRSRQRRATVATLVAGTAAIAGLVSQASAQPATMEVTGHVATQVTGGPDCAAPTGQCFEGEITGVISGSVRPR